MLVLLACFASCIRLPPELRNENRHSTSNIRLGESLPSTDQQIVSHLRISQPVTNFLSQYSESPINIVFCSFENFFKTPVLVSGSMHTYLEPEWNELPVFTTRQNDESMIKTNNQSYFTMRLCSFYNCKNSFAGEEAIGGGALYCTEATRIYSCTFTQCSTTIGHGGAIYAKFTDSTGRLLINSCSFMSCSSKESGGSLACYNCRLEIFRTEFLISKAAIRGGAFYYDQDSNKDILYILSCMFYQCSVDNPHSDPQVFYANMNPDSPKYPLVKLDFCRFSQPLPDDVLADDFTGAGMWEIVPVANYMERYRNRYGTAIEAVHVTPTYTFSAMATMTPMASATPNATETQSPSETPTQSATYSLSRSPTRSALIPPSTSLPPWTPRPSATAPATRSVSASRVPQRTTPAASISRSQTYSRSPTKSAAASASATVSQSPMATCTPSASDTPAISWGSLSLGLLIFGLLILIIGVIANVILCAMCCRPSEILARQYV